MTLHWKNTRKKGRTIILITKRTVLMQMRLMFRQKTFALGFGINLLYVLVTFLYYALVHKGQDVSTILSPNAVFALNSNTVFFDTFINIVPFITILPFSMSYMRDKINETLPVIQSRAGIKNYYISKVFVCFIGGFVIFFIPLIINMSLNQLIFPQSGITSFGDMFDPNYNSAIMGNNILIETIQSGILLPRLYLYSADLYNLFFVFIFSISMGVFSVFNLAISFILKRNRMLLFIPIYVIVVFFNTLDFILSKNRPFVSYKVMMYLSVNSHFGKSQIFIWAFFISLIIFSAVMINIQIRKDQI